MEEPLLCAVEISPLKQMQAWPVLEYVTCLGKRSHTLPNPEPSNPLR